MNLLRITLLAGLLPASLCPLSAATTTAELLSAFSANPHNHPHLADNSYAGYFRGEIPIPEVPVAVNVTEAPYNADPAPGVDNTAAIQAALDDVGHDGGGAVYLPAGTYEIHGMLFINHDNVVLRGAGEGQTILDFTTDLKDLLSVDGIDPPYSWAGGHIWISPQDYFQNDDRSRIRYAVNEVDNSDPHQWEYYRPGAQLAEVTGEHPRGDFSLTVSDAGALQAGDWILLSWKVDTTETFTKDIAAFSQWEIPTQDNWENAFELSGYDVQWITPWTYNRYQWPVEIKSVTGNEITLRQPLRVAITDGTTGTDRDVRVYRTGDMIDGAGVESLTLQGYNRADYTVDAEWRIGFSDGWNGVYLQRARNCWVRNVETVDQHLSVIGSAVKQCTFSNIHIRNPENRSVHNLIDLRTESADNLVENVFFDIPDGVDPDADGDLNNPHPDEFHGHGGLMIEWFSSGNVFRNNTLEWGCLDYHRGLPFDVLHTGSTFIRNNAGPGGNAKAGPMAGRRVTHWNLEMEKGDYINMPMAFPNGVLAGLRDLSGGDPPPPEHTTRPRRGVAYGDKNALVLEPGTVPLPADLYLWQRQQRLGDRVPATVAIIHPGEGDAIADASVPLQPRIRTVVHNSQSLAEVRLYLDGTLVDTSALQDWSPALTGLSEGRHALRAEAELSDGTVVTSNRVTFSFGYEWQWVDDRDPAISYTSMVPQDPSVSWEPNEYPDSDYGRNDYVYEPGSAINDTYTRTSNYGDPAGSFTYNFSGNRIRVRVPTVVPNGYKPYFDAGISVYLDDLDTPVATFDFRDPSNNPFFQRYILWDSGPIADGVHTIRVEIGEPFDPDRKSESHLAFDAFEILRSSSTEQLDYFTLEATATEGGTVNGGGVYPEGETVTITANAESGYLFNGWSGSDAIADPDSPTTTVTLQQNESVQATFMLDSAQLRTLTVASADTTMGSASGSGEYIAGSHAQISATPEIGYTFDQWTGTGISDPDSATTTVLVDEDKTVTATFASAGDNLATIAGFNFDSTDQTTRRSATSFIGGADVSSISFGGGQDETGSEPGWMEVYKSSSILGESYLQFTVSSLEGSFDLNGGGLSFRLNQDNGSGWEVQAAILIDGTSYPLPSLVPNDPDFYEEALSGLPITTSFTVRVYFKSDAGWNDMKVDDLKVEGFFESGGAPDTSPVIAQTELPPAATGEAYTAQFSSTSGNAPLTWNITAGTLPTGLGLAPDTGLLSGTTGQPGTYSFTVEVVDTDGDRDSKAFDLAVLDSGNYHLSSSSWLGGTGNTDRVHGSAILSDGTLVLAVNLDDASPYPFRESFLLNADASSRGAILRLSPHGRQLLSLTRLADEVLDLAVDDNDRLYVAAGSAGLVALSADASTVRWQRGQGTYFHRVDSAWDGSAVVALHPDSIGQRETKPGSGHIYLYDGDGTALNDWSGYVNTLDVAVHGPSQSVYYIGFKNLHTYVPDGAPGYSDNHNIPVDIPYLRSVPFSFDGSNSNWIAYDWEGDVWDDFANKIPNERWINFPNDLSPDNWEGGSFPDSPDSGELIVRSTSNMADTRGYRVEIGRDDKLYALFDVDGGNHPMRADPFDLGSLDANLEFPESSRNDPDRLAKEAGGDWFHQGSNSSTVPKTWFGRYDPVSGELLRGQLFTCRRTGSGYPPDNTTESRAIAADENGSVVIAGNSFFGLPLPGNESYDKAGSPSDTGDLVDRLPGESYKGGAFLIQFSPDFEQRTHVHRTGGGRIWAVDTRILGGQRLLFGGELNDDLSDTLYATTVANALQPSPGTPPSDSAETRDGFFTFLHKGDLPAFGFPSFVAEHNLPGGADSRTADPDGDGLVNVGEYALGLDPNIPESPQNRLSPVMDGDTLQLRFRRNADLPDVRYRVQASSDLQTWNTLYDSGLEPRPNNDGDYMIIPDNVTVPSDGGRFLRLQLD